MRSGQGQVNSVDPEDEIEEGLTEHILRTGISEILRCCVAILLARNPRHPPEPFEKPSKIGWRSNRGILRHLMYLMESTVSLWCRGDAIQHVHVHFGTNLAAIAMLARYFSP